MTWPKEELRRTRAQRAEFLDHMAETAKLERWKHVKPYPEDEDLRRAVVEQFDNDAPRQAYAAWMLAQGDENARRVGEFVEQQLAVADMYRINPRVEVPREVRRRGMRAAPHHYDVDLLFSERLIVWPMFFRGFIEHVGVRAPRLLEIADELFSLAPIRHLTLGGVPAVVDQLAAWPHLRRIRSLSLPEHGPDDALTDDVLARLLASPHLVNLTHLELIDQTQLTPHAYELVVSTSTLPALSNFEVRSLTALPQVWTEHVDPPTRGSGRPSHFEELMDGYPQANDLRNTPKPVVVRSEDWIIELERKLGYVPCVHPEEHYGRYVVDVEAVTAHPIALDAAITARRGQPAPDPGPKPSLMGRRREGRCAICGSVELAFERGPKLPPDFELWGDAMGSQVPTVNPNGVWICDHCGTRWKSAHWPELPAPPPRPEEL